MARLSPAASPAPKPRGGTRAALVARPAAQVPIVGLNPQKARAYRRQIANLPLPKAQKVRLRKMLEMPAERTVPLRRLLHGVRTLDVKSQAKLLQPTAISPTGRAAQSSRTIVASGEWKRFNGRERQIVADVFARGSRSTSVAKLPGYAQQVFALGLDGKQKRQLLRAAYDGKEFSGTQRASVQTALEGVKGLRPEAQRGLLSPIAQNPKSDAAKAVLELVTSFKQLPPSVQGKLANLAGHTTGAQGIYDLARLAKDPARLMSADAHGMSLLDNLDGLTRVPLNAAFKGRPTRGQLITDILEEVSRPGQINQSVFGTCSVTSVQFELVADHPSEYVRLMTGLISTEGRAQMRGGGALELQTDYFGGDEKDKRSFSEAIFQGAAMEYGNGANLDYQGRRILQGGEYGASVSSDGQLYAGMQDVHVLQLMNGLFGNRFHMWSSRDPGAIPQQIEALRSYSPQGPNAPILLLLGIGAQQGTNHFVTFVGSRDGRIYFRNPWGPTKKPNGSEEAEHGWRIEDGALGLYSMTEEEFARRVKSIEVPTSVHTAPNQAV